MTEGFSETPFLSLYENKFSSTILKAGEKGETKQKNKSTQ